MKQSLTAFLAQQTGSFVLVGTGLSGVVKFCIEMGWADIAYVYARMAARYSFKRPPLEMIAKVGTERVVDWRFE